MGSNMEELRSKVDKALNNPATLPQKIQQALAAETNSNKKVEILAAEIGKDIGKEQ